MISDMSQIYEKNLSKYYFQLDEQISKFLIYEKKYSNEIILPIDNIFSNIEKTAKDYIIFLTINGPYQQRIKNIEKKLKEYKNKIKEIKNKNKSTEIIPEYNKENYSIESFKSFNKMNNAIKTVIDIESMSNNVLSNLEEQTIGMKNTTDKIMNTNEVLDESKNELNEMLIKNNKDKKIIILIGGILSLLLIIIISLKLYSKFVNK